MFSYPTVAALSRHLVELAQPAPAAGARDEAIESLSGAEIARRIGAEFDALMQSAP
jgi:hypothetical protein